MIPIFFDVVVTAGLFAGLIVLLGVPRMIGRARLRGARGRAALPDAQLDELELAELTPGLRDLVELTRTSLAILEVPTRVVRETVAAGALGAVDEEFTMAMSEISKETLQWLATIDGLPEADAERLHDLGYTTDPVRTAIAAELTAPAWPAATLRRVELTIESMVRLEPLLRARRENPYR